MAGTGETKSVVYVVSQVTGPRGTSLDDQSVLGVYTSVESAYNHYVRIVGGPGYLLDEWIRYGLGEDPNVIIGFEDANQSEFQVVAVPLLEGGRKSKQQGKRIGKQKKI
jgi:hypothetical protein